MEENSKAFAVVGLIVTILLACVVADCSSGKFKHYECVVSSHRYEPEWTELRHTTDSDGNSHVTTINHPEEWHVICNEQEGSQKVFDCETSRDIYNRVTNSQSVTVRTRVGKWTGIDYLATIEE